MIFINWGFSINKTIFKIHNSHSHVVCILSAPSPCQSVGVRSWLHATNLICNEGASSSIFAADRNHGTHLTKPIV